MKNIVIIAESINVEDSSGSKVNVALIRNLNEAGFKLKVLHYSHKAIQLPGIDCELIKENKFSTWFILSRLQRVFTRWSGVNINPFVERLLGFSFTHTNDTNSITYTLKKYNFKNVHYIITLSKGGSFRPHRAMLNLVPLHNRWIANIHDPYPFHFYPRPYNWVEPGYFQKQKLIENIASSAKWLSFPSGMLKDWMGSYFPKIKGKSIIIPHQINLVAQTTKMVPDFFDKSKFNLLHAGNLLGYRDPKYIIEAVLRLIEKFPESKDHIRLLLIGPHTSFKGLLSEYADNSNIIIREHMNYDIIRLMEQEASVNIILEAISEISPFLPGKFPNIIDAQRPILVLGPYYSESRRLLGNNYEYWSEPNDIDKIEKLICELYSKWLSSERMNYYRPDLSEYLNADNLKTIFQKLGD